MNRRSLFAPSRTRGLPCRRLRAAILAGLIALASGPACAQEEGILGEELPPVALRVSNPTDDRIDGGTIRAMVAFGRDEGPRSTEHLRILNSRGEPVPCDFRVISRWNGLRDDSRARIRILHAYFRGSVPPRGVSAYRLEAGAWPPAAAAGFAVEEDETAITISRGDDSWRLRKDRLVLFDRVVLDGREVVPVGGGGSWPAAPVETSFHFRGSTAVIVNQRIALDRHVYLDIRYTFLEPRDTVVEFRIAQELGPRTIGGHAAFGTPWYLDTLWAEIPIVRSGALRTNGSEEDFERYAEVRDQISWAADQDRILVAGIPSARHLMIDSRRGGKPVYYDDGVVVEGSAGGVAIGWRHFSEKAPHQIHVSGGRVRIAPWPADPLYRPFVFRGHRADGGSRISHSPLGDGYYPGPRPGAVGVNPRSGRPWQINDEAPHDFPGPENPCNAEPYPDKPGTVHGQQSRPEQQTPPAGGAYVWDANLERWSAKGVPGLMADPRSVYSYRLPSAWFTDHLFLRWFTPDAVPSPQAVYERAHADILALTDLDRYFSTRALGGDIAAPFLPDDVDGDVNRFQLFTMCYVDDSYAEPQRSAAPGPAFEIQARDGIRFGWPAFMDSGGRHPGAVWRRPYGRDIYGGIEHRAPDDLTNLSYDSPAWCLRDFLRSGDHRFLQLGTLMALYRRDLTHVHGTGSDHWSVGGDWYETAKVPVSSAAIGVNASHTWVRGTVLHYLITGDEWSRDVLFQKARFWMAGNDLQRPGGWTGVAERTVGWAIQGLVDIHAALGPIAVAAKDGPRRPLEECKLGILRYMEYEQGMRGSPAHPGYKRMNFLPADRSLTGKEIDFTGRGFILFPGPSGTTTHPDFYVQPWMTAIAANGIAQYLDESRDDDATVRALYDRMVDWLASTYLHGGGHYKHAWAYLWYPDGRVHENATRVDGKWVWKRHPGEQQPTKFNRDAMMFPQLAGALAWADRITGRDYSETVERIFRMCARYPKSGGGDPYEKLGSWSYARPGEPGYDLIYDERHRRRPTARTEIVNHLFASFAWTKQLNAGTMRHMPAAIALLVERGRIQVR